jgi:uncharacterized membrane protein
MTSKVKTSRFSAIHWQPISTTYDTNWRQLSFWRDVFWLFWIFSLIGHLIEFVWALLLQLFGEPSHIATIPILAVAAPYGLGALALIWTIYPLIKRRQVGIFKVYLAGVLITTAIEFICAGLIVLVMGFNPFWNYSDQPFNLLGFVCLRNSLAFGLVAVPMLYFVFPIINNWLKKIPKRLLNPISLALFVGYVAVQIWRIWFRA